MEKTYRIVTHSGRFHLDELLACATLTLLLEKEGKTWEIVRSRDPQVWQTADFVVDVGMEYDPARGRFDHHQQGGAGTHENGIPLSSFGAVWKSYGQTLCGDERIASAIERKLVYPVDMGDNGISAYAPTYDDIHPYVIQQFVMALVPTWKEGEIQDERFFEALGYMRRLLDREIIYERDRLEGLHFVQEAYERAEDKRVVVLDRPYPSADFLAECPEPLFVVKPARQNSNWEVEAVRSDPHAFINRKDLPQTWAGKSGEELVRVTGVPDAVFCHLKRFVAVARSKEGAIELAKLALQA